MKQAIITPGYLLKFMTEDQYEDFLADLQEEYNISHNEPIFIIAEWGEKE